MRGAKLGYLMLAAYWFGFISLSGFAEIAIGRQAACIGVCNRAEGSISLAIILGLSGFAIATAAVALRRWTIRASNQRLAIVAVVATALSNAMVFVYIWHFDLDDKWLYYRTSLHALQTGKASWNLEDNINLSTGFLWPYVAAIAHFFPDWNTAIKGIGIAFLAGAVGLLAFAVRRNILAVVLAVGTLGAYLPLSLWSLGGMETAMAAAWAVVAVVAFREWGPTNTWTWFVLASGVFVRPEFAIMPAVAWFLFFLFADRPILEKVAAAAPVVLMPLAWLGANFALYGDPLPTAAYFKTIAGGAVMFQAGQSREFVVTNGLVQFLSALVANFFGAILFSVGIFEFGRRLRAPRTLAQPGILLIAGFNAVALYHIIGGYLHMGFAFRYLIPAIVGGVATVLVFYEPSVRRVLEWIGGRADGRPALIAVTLLLLVQIPVFWIDAYAARKFELSLTRATHRDAFSLDQYSGFMADWESFGPFLKSVATKGERLWMKDGANLSGGAIADIYSLDGLYAPLAKSYVPEIQKCKGWACAEYFDYIFVQGVERSTWRDFLGGKFEVLKEGQSITLLRRVKRDGET